MSLINFTPLNFTEQFSALNNFTTLGENISSSGWFYPVYAVYGAMANVVWLMVIVFMVGIVYIRTRSLPAVAFVSVLFAGIVSAFVPNLGAKIIYIVVIFALAGTLWAVFGRK